MVEEWDTMLDKGKYYGVLLTDLSKTFWLYIPWSTYSKNFVHMVFMTYHYNYVTSGNFAGTVVNVATLFPENLNENKDNSF